MSLRSHGGRPEGEGLWLSITSQDSISSKLQYEHFMSDTCNHFETDSQNTSVLGSRVQLETF
ncbi:hypothetical protein F2P79_005397 [Pimephales promelas]|nr:hypothetical protein F2P79_005397 [Pimephales promelas]